MLGEGYPKVIVLVLSYNGKHLLDEALTSYLANDYPNFEITVIDNGSIDGTVGFIKEKFPRVKVIRTEKNLGYSGGFNLGLDYAFNKDSADYALVTNNDVKADKKTISELVKVAETDKKIGFVTGKVYFYDQPNILQSVGKKEDPIKWNGEHIGNKEEDRGQYDQISERAFSDDIYTLVSKRLYADIGGYDTLFRFQSEEYDWQARAKEKGYKIMYTPYAKLWHKASATIGKDSAFKAYYDARNPMLVILLHKSPDFFRRYFWNHVRIILLTLLRRIKHLRFYTALKTIEGLFSAIWWGLNHRKLTLRHFI